MLTLYGMPLAVELCILLGKAQCGKKDKPEVLPFLIRYL